MDIAHLLIKTSCFSFIIETLSIKFGDVVRKVKVLEDSQGPQSICFSTKQHEEEGGSVSSFGSYESDGEREFKVAVEEAMRDGTTEEVSDGDGGGKFEGEKAVQALCSGINRERGSCMVLEYALSDTMQEGGFNTFLGQFTEECVDSSDKATGVGTKVFFRNESKVGPMVCLKNLGERGKGHVECKKRMEVRRVVSEVVGQFDLALKGNGSGVFKAHAFKATCLKI